MAIIQRVEHLAEYVEKLVIGGQRGNSGSVDLVLLFPVDISQLEKWIPIMKGFPQFFEIEFRVPADSLHKGHIARNQKKGLCLDSRIKCSTH
jgi:hypothetical protein